MLLGRNPRRVGAEGGEAQSSRGRNMNEVVGGRVGASSSKRTTPSPPLAVRQFVRVHVAASALHGFFIAP